MGFFRFPILFSFCISHFSFHIPNIPHIPEIPHITDIPHIPHIPHIPEIFDLGIFPIFIFPFDLGNLTLAFLKFLTFHTFHTFLKYLTLGFRHIFSWWWFLHILCQSPHSLYYSLVSGFSLPFLENGCGK